MSFTPLIPHTTAGELLGSVIVLEEALPCAQSNEIDKVVLPTRAVTLASLAVRLYALDRTLAYDEIKEVESLPGRCIR
jgi:hypothetical protein